MCKGSNAFLRRSLMIIFTIAGTRTGPVQDKKARLPLIRLSGKSEHDGRLSLQRF
jgi:hypothetical protein